LGGGSDLPKAEKNRAFSANKEWNFKEKTAKSPPQWTDKREGSLVGKLDEHYGKRRREKKPLSCRTQKSRQRGHHLRGFIFKTHNKT